MPFQVGADFEAEKWSEHYLQTSPFAVCWIPHQTCCVSRLSDSSAWEIQSTHPRLTMDTPVFVISPPSPTEFCCILPSSCCLPGTALTS